MTIANLIAEFERWANPTWQEKWDNCGWQVEPGILTEIPGVLVCLTPTLAVMEEAIALRNQGYPVNLIFAHHPLIFGGISSVVADDHIGQMVKAAFTHSIGIYTAHTNFDQVTDGTADVLAQLLNLQSTKPVEVTAPQVDPSRGYGRVGDWQGRKGKGAKGQRAKGKGEREQGSNQQGERSLQTLLEIIQATLSPPKLLFSPTTDFQQSIQRVAVLGGSGASYISSVVKTGAQAYLTADCKFHQFQESRDQGLVLIDAGHYATERPACARLVSWMTAHGAQWAQLSEKDEDFRQFF